jgi:hypothetical protein
VIEFDWGYLKLFRVFANIPSATFRFTEFVSGADSSINNDSRVFARLSALSSRRQVVGEMSASSYVLLAPAILGTGAGKAQKHGGRC